tara:strand:+ start:1092 stop:1415 length:324 start_codon:yes stop_codon:yes gene_type:complete
MDRSFTAGLVVIKKAYSLNCFCPASPGINNCKFPTRCPSKNITRKSPEAAARVFLKRVELKYEFIPCFCKYYRIEIKTINQFGHKESQPCPIRPISLKNKYYKIREG